MKNQAVIDHLRYYYGEDVAEVAEQVADGMLTPEQAFELVRYRPEEAGWGVTE